METNKILCQICEQKEATCKLNGSFCCTTCLNEWSSSDKSMAEIKFNNLEYRLNEPKKEESSENKILLLIKGVLETETRYSSAGIHSYYCPFCDEGSLFNQMDQIIHMADCAYLLAKELDKSSSQ